MTPLLFPAPMETLMRSRLTLSLTFRNGRCEERKSCNTELMTMVPRIPKQQGEEMRGLEETRRKKKGRNNEEKENTRLLCFYTKLKIKVSRPGEENLLVIMISRAAE